MQKILLFENFIFESLAPDEIHKKYYNDIDIDMFDQIVKNDPTSKVDPETDMILKVGRYSKWMIDLFRNDNLLEEDLYKFKETLEYFHDLNIRGILKKNDISNDINSYKTLPKLWGAIKDLIDTDDESSLSNKEIEKLVKSKEAEKVWETDNCYVYKMMSHRAACYYGKGTRWCTASKDDPKYFNQYSQDAPLYVIIDKVDKNEKYQMHVPSRQFANIDDDMLEGFEIAEVLERYQLDNSDFINTIIQPKYELYISDEIYYKKMKDQWYFIFKNWTSLSNIFSVSSIQDGDLLWEILDHIDERKDNTIDFININISDLDEYPITIDSNLFNRIIDNLKDIDPEYFEKINGEDLYTNTRQSYATYSDLQEVFDKYLDDYDVLGRHSPSEIHIFIYRILDNLVDDIQEYINQLIFNYESNKIMDTIQYELKINTNNYKMYEGYYIFEYTKNMRLLDVFIDCLSDEERNYNKMDYLYDITPAFIAAMSGLDRDEGFKKVVSNTIINCID